MGTDGTGVTVHQHASIHVARLDPGVAAEHASGAGRGDSCYLSNAGATCKREHLATGGAAGAMGDGLPRAHARATRERLALDMSL